ncbi:MAG: hypothetical protein DMG55_14290 [Acidobacteria bacterium]|nr:MAG: hypothetical protein DMG55_14290 [Acidobacteriota bacterium]
MATPNKKIRVLVVEDSLFMRKVLEGIFNADEQLQVVGNAKDGREAVALAESLKPDVITMDINMPHVDGLQATAEIMTTNPAPFAHWNSVRLNLSPSPPAPSTSTCRV